MMSRDNNLQFLRLIFASMVWVAHSFSICYLPEPIVGRGYNLGSIGGLGVFGFFTISGFLIPLSYLRSRSLWQFLWNRFLRIAPALWLSVLLGAVFAFFTLNDQTSFLKFATSNETLSYIFKNALLWHDAPPMIAGAFTENRYAVINGPLWTLPLEVRMYLFVAACGLLCVLEERFFALFLVILAFLDLKDLYHFLLLGIAEPNPLQAALPPLYFFAGMYFSLKKMPLKAKWFAFAGPVAVVAAFFEIPLLIQVACTAYSIYYVAFRINIFRSFFNSIGDYSYGIYIYAFPIQQFSYYLIKKYSGHPPSLFVLMASSGCAIIIFSMLSWFYIEKPSLKLKSLFAEPVQE